GHADRVASVDELLVDLYVEQGRYADALERSARWFGEGRQPRSISDERQLERVRRHGAILRALGRRAEAAGHDAAAARLTGAVEARRRELVTAPEAQDPDTPRACSSNAWIAGAVFPSP